MRISFSPQFRDDTLIVSKTGDILTINGAEYDFTSVPDGATIPAGATGCEWIVGSIDRVDGQLHITLLLPYCGEADESVTHPQPLINPPNGDLAMPRCKEVEHVET